MWLCVPESEREVGWVSTLHKRQIRVSNFSLQCPALYPFGMSIRRLALCKEATVFLVRKKHNSQLQKTSARLHIERYTCSYVEEEVVVIFGQQKKRAYMKTKTNMSALKSVAFQL